MIWHGKKYSLSLHATLIGSSTPFYKGIRGKGGNPYPLSEKNDIKSRKRKKIFILQSTTLQYNSKTCAKWLQAAMYRKININYFLKIKKGTFYPPRRLNSTGMEVNKYQRKREKSIN